MGELCEFAVEASVISEIFALLGTLTYERAAIVQVIPFGYVLAWVKDRHELTRMRTNRRAFGRNHQHQTTGVLLFGGRPDGHLVAPCRQESWRP